VTPLGERPALYAPALALAALVVAAALHAAGAFEPLELALYDRLLAARAAGKPAGERVVLVGADEEDVVKLGWPASDAVLAQLLEKILAQRPRAVGLDIYRDQPRPPGHEALVRALGREQVFGVMKVGGEVEPGVPPPPVLAGTDRIGFADVPVDPGGTVRRGLLFLDDGKETHTAFALRLALRYLAADGIAPQAAAEDPALMKLGAATLRPFEGHDGGYVNADAGGYQFLLDFAGGAAPFPRHRFSDVLEGRVPADAFADRVVLVGVTAPSVKDFFDTPFSRDPSSATVHGIALHGHVASQLVRMAKGETRPVAAVPQAAELALLAAACLLGALAGAFVHGAGRFAALAVAGVALLGVASWASFQRDLWLPFSPQALGWLMGLSLTAAYALHVERAQRGQLMSIFSRYMAPDLAADVWKRRGEFLQPGGRPRPQRLEATVLFSDIKGFTAVSEALDPAGLMDWLNAYMERMAGLVMQHGGVVDKFIGDAVMAVFGIPMARAGNDVAEDARRTVRCALAMRSALESFNGEWQARGVPAIGIRVGIHSGTVISGSLGSAERMEYTVIGDTVNTASRLESFKLAPGESPPEALADEGSGACRILVCETNARLLGAAFRLTQVGAVRLQGKQDAVTVYSVAGEG
jgi:adenylate cyclase